MSTTRKRAPRRRTRVASPSRSARGATFDTGMLIALQGRNQFALQCLALLRNQRARITIPSTVVAEFWRGEGRRLLEIGEIEPLTPRLAEAAGELLAATRRANAIDATVVASAAQRGDQVFTKNEGDLEVLAAQVDGVEVVRV
jgi:predicted nucleic acid-binding protein